MTKASDISAPSSTNNIVEDIEQWLDRHGLLGTSDFECYDNALKAVWPQLYITNQYKALFLAINVYLECANKRGFEISPDFLSQAEWDDLI